MTRNANVMTAKDPRHGTANGYTNLGCRCEACRKAGAEANRQQKRKRLKVTAAGLMPPSVIHGENAYTNWVAAAARVLMRGAAAATARNRARA